MKTLFTILMVLLVAFSASAQLNLGLGISYDHGKPNVLGESFESDEPETFTESVICGSLATGVGINGSVGIDICKHGEIKLGANYLFGSNKMVDESTSNSFSGEFTSTEYQQYSRLDLRPGIRINTNGDGKLNYFGEAGAIVPILNKTTIETTSNNPFTDKQERTIERKDRFSLGGYFGVGVEYSLSDNINLFGEVGSNVITGKTKSSEITSIIEGGEEQDLDEEDTYFLQTNYQMEIDENSNNFGFNDEANENDPKEELEMSNNYASAYFRFGVRLEF